MSWSSATSTSIEEEQPAPDERSKTDSVSFMCPGFPPFKDLYGNIVDWRLGHPYDKFGLLLFESVYDFDNDSRGFGRCIPLLKNSKKWVIKEGFPDIRTRYNSLPDLVSSRCAANYKIKDEATKYKLTRKPSRSSWSLQTRSFSTSNMDSLDYVNIIDDSKLYEDFENFLEEYPIFEYF